MLPCWLIYVSIRMGMISLTSNEIAAIRLVKALDWERVNGGALDLINFQATAEDHDGRDVVDIECRRGRPWPIPTVFARKSITPKQIVPLSPHNDAGLDDVLSSSASSSSDFDKHPVHGTSLCVPNSSSCAFAHVSGRNINQIFRAKKQNSRWTCWV